MHAGASQECDDGGSMWGLGYRGSTGPHQCPAGPGRRPEGYRGAPREVSTSLILIIPHGTARGAPLQNVAGPTFSELRGHPGGTWGCPYAVIATGLRGTRGHPGSQHCGKYNISGGGTMVPLWGGAASQVAVALRAASGRRGPRCSCLSVCLPPATSHCPETPPPHPPTLPPESRTTTHNCL